jgi:D-3-phosphoglycerate dehydrogenase
MELVLAARDEPLAASALRAAIRDADAAILGLDACDASVLDACPRLRVVSRYGVGVDNVDLDAARRLGIAVTNTPGANTTAVAELTLGSILALARRLPQAVAATRAGSWSRRTGWELSGKTLGVIGYGRIGQAVADLGRAFGMRVVASDPFAPPTDGTTVLTVDELLGQADVVTLHVGLSDDTRHLIDGAALARMKPGAVLVNTARGGLIDEDALAEALRSGRLAGAAADAFEHEPPGASPLLAIDSFLPTPHLGAATAEATARMGQMATENALDVLQGRTPAHVVVPPDPKRRSP